MHNDSGARDPADVTGAVALLRGLSSETVAALAGMPRALTLAPGESLFPDDDSSDELYLVEKGRAARGGGRGGSG